MLKNIESIHTISRKLAKKLSDVMASPDVTKQLGSVLMWFVDVMEVPYSNYCRNHVPQLDNWPEIINNTRLQDILTVGSASHITVMMTLNLSGGHRQLCSKFKEREKSDQLTSSGDPASPPFLPFL